MEEMLMQATGHFSGIGVEIIEDEGEILIQRVISDTPAYFAGLRQGDRIVGVEGKSIFGLTSEEAARLLRGVSGTEVNITVRRPGESGLLFVNLTRAQIDRESVFIRRFEGGVACLHITNFDEGTVDVFESALETLENEGLEGLIIDLRNNPGGLFDEAIAIGEIIVPEGEITRVVDRDGNVLSQFFSRAEPKDYPLVLLVNELTASAAEILGGALQDSGKAYLVGMPTFGKTSVQHLQHLSDGGGLRYTIAKYLTPNGTDLHHVGLKPDYEMELPPEYYLQYNAIPREIQPGDRGEKVALLQSMLDFLGYPLEITGIFDEHLSGALQSFQTEHGLHPGVLDDPTREAMRIALNSKGVEVDEQLNFALNLLRDLR
jgi:carboxyl-terminal processing protease